MKQILIVFILSMSFAVSVDAQFKDVEKIETVKKEGGPIMTMDALEVDYGTIEQNSEPLRTLDFTNTGDEPLVIKNARGSCGCTVPTWSKEPILPGETSQLEIRYATNRLGPFSKKVTLTTNEGGEPVVIKVHGKVLKPEEEESVPAAAPSLIKSGS